MADAVYILHEDGTTTDYNSGANTDVSRGAALVTALAAAQAWEKVIAKDTAGNFDAVTTQVVIPANVILNLASKTLYSQLSADLEEPADGLGAGNKACVRPGSSNSGFRNAVLHANNSLVQQTPMGVKGDDAGAGGFLNFHIENVTGIAAVDNIHFTQANVTYTFVAKNVTAHNSFDAFVHLGSGGAAGSIGVYIGCTARCKYVNDLYPYPSYASALGTTCRAVTNTDADASAYIYGGTYSTQSTSGGASTINTIQRTNGFVGVYGATLTSTSAGASPLDIAGNTTVSNTTSYNAGKTSGTITVVTAWRPAPCTNLVATAGAGKIDLTWDNNWTADGGAATGIIVEVSSDNSSWSQLGSTLAAGAVSVSHTGLSEGNLRYYRVTPTNASGDAVMKSNVVRATAAAAATVVPSTRMGCSIGMGIGV